MSSRHGWKWMTLGVIAALIVGCAPSVEELQEAGDVPGLVELLGSDAAVDARANAASALGTLGDAAAVDPLITALADPDASIRAAAANALGLLADEAAVDPLLARLADDDEAVRGSARAALTQLAEALDANVLVPILVEALADEATTIRAVAAELLGTTSEPAALMPLLVALQDGDAAVRMAVSDALAGLGEQVDPDALVAILVDALGNDTASIRATAAEMLGQTGERAALTPLLGAVGDGDGGVGQAATEAVARLLADLGNAAQPVLFAALDEGPATRAAAIDALSRIGDGSAVEPLLLAVSDEVAEIGAAAQAALTEVLARTSAGEAVGILLGSVTDDRAAVAEAATAALTDLLGELGPTEASAALLAAGAGDRWLAIGLGVDESQLAAETRRLNLQLDPIDEIFAAATGVRDGEGVDGVRAYEASDAYHPAVVIAATFTVPESWAPTATRYLELVVVEDDISWAQIQECLYEGPSIIRYRGTQTVRVLSAADGSLVAEKSFQGPDPRQCAATEDYWLTELYGDDPDLTPAVEWLESIIHSPS